MAHKDGDLSCCKNIKTTLKVKDNHVSSRTALSFKNTLAIIAPVFFLPVSHQSVTKLSRCAYNSQAPPLGQPPLYILYATYRI
jgi:hypothetical protein